MKFARRHSSRKNRISHDPDNQVLYACQVLTHYTVEHTQDAMTRFTGKPPKEDPNAETVDIYVIRDPSWKEKLKEFTQGEFLHRQELEEPTIQ